MNQIVKETQISKGKVHYLIINWKEKTKETDIDKVRDFSNLVKRSSISIEQCTQGFRMLNILKSFDIVGNLEFTTDNDGSYNGDGDHNDIGNHTNDDDNFTKFFSFVQEIYNNCKKLEISPVVITSWIKDLVDFQNMIIDINDKVFDGDNDDIIKQPTITTAKPIQEEEVEKNLKDFENPINKEIEEHSNLKDNNDGKMRGSSIETVTQILKSHLFLKYLSLFLKRKKRWARYTSIKKP
jgi:hypothetical protein